MHIETLDAVYEDMESLTNLDVANTTRCGQHVKNCSLQNIDNIIFWWLDRLDACLSDSKVLSHSQRADKASNKNVVQKKQSDI